MYLPFQIFNHLSVFKIVNLYFSTELHKILMFTLWGRILSATFFFFFLKRQNIIMIISFCQLKSPHSWQSSQINQFQIIHLIIICITKFVSINFSFVRTCRVIASSTGFTWVENCPLVLHDLAELHTYACFICWGVPLGSGGLFLSIPWGVCIPWGGGCIPGDIPGRMAVKKIDNNSEKYIYLFKKSAVCG